MEKTAKKVLEVKDLVISFKTDRGIVHAVRGVSFDLFKGETLCIVGESGSGKSVTNKAVMGISAKNAIIERGSIMYEGEDLTRVSEEEFHRIRGHKIGMIFQDPLSALNPVMRIGKQIIEATMLNKNILKRRFADITAPALSALRNNEANLAFQERKIEHEVSGNEKTIGSYNSLSKAIASLKKRSEKASGAKKEAIDNELNELNGKMDDLLFHFVEYKNGVLKANELEIELGKENLALLEGAKAKNEFEAKINENAIKTQKETLAFIGREDFYKLGDDVAAALTKRNQELAEFVKLLRKNAKESEPALKENYKAAKASAKIEVAEYAKQLKAEHIATMDSLIQEAIDNGIAVSQLRKKLSKEELSAIDEVVSYNKALKKKRAKEATKFKENAISATVAKKEDFKEIPNKEYAALVKDAERIEKALFDEEKAYINKTMITKAEAKRLALNVMREVGIPMPERRFKQYPFEFSGGMRQRIVIAIALTADPEILICDEPTTALDVTIQAQILELINRLKKERNLSCIFITHDLGVVANMADRVAVMYAGKIVEYGKADEVFFDPKHPYTWALLSSIPDVDSKEKLEAIPGTPPDMIYPPKGDAFALRSSYAMAIDFKAEPPYFKLSDTHYAATWLLHPDAPKVKMPKIVEERIKNALKGGK